MSAVLPTALVVFIAQAQPPAPGADRGQEFGKTSPIALVVVLLLGIATALLIRSMGKRLRNIPESFDPPEARDEPQAESGPESSSEPGPKPDPELDPEPSSESDPEPDPEPARGPSSGPVDGPSPGRQSRPEG